MARDSFVCQGNMYEDNTENTRNVSHVRAKPKATRRNAGFSRSKRFLVGKIHPCNVSQLPRTGRPPSDRPHTTLTRLHLFTMGHGSTSSILVTDHPWMLEGHFVIEQLAYHSEVRLIISSLFINCVEIMKIMLSISLNQPFRHPQSGFVFHRYTQW